MTGEMFGPYRLVALLGRGGMGEVWRAVDTRKDREVAIKVLGAWLGGDPDFARRFRRESALVARLNAPNIVPIHDYGAIDGRLFIDMPLIVGTDLSVLLGRGGPLPPARAVGIVTQVARALAVAHRAGLVHRDVKPSNVLISDVEGDDHVYLIDFGISHAVDGSRISLSGSAVGTPAYMAPERFEGEGDHRSDVYALGCVLHEALTARPPFVATSPLVFMNAHQSAPPPRPSAARPGLPPALDGVVARAMAKDPGSRFGTVTDLAVAARDALDTAPPTRVEPHVLLRPTLPGHAPRPATRATTRGARSPGALLGGLLAVVAVVAVFVGSMFLVRGNDPGKAAAGGSAAGATLLQPVAERELIGHTGRVNAVATADVDGRIVVVSGSFDGTVRVWDPTTGQPIEDSIPDTPGLVFAVATADVDGRTVVVSGNLDGSVRVWDALTGAPAGASIAGPAREVYGVATGELDGRTVIVSGGDDRIVRVSDPVTGGLAGQLIGHTGPVYAVATAVSNGRALVVSGSFDGTVRVWDSVTSGLVGQFIGHTGAVRSVASAGLDGRTVVVSGGDDGTVRVWDLVTGQQVGGDLVGHAGAVLAVTTAEIDGRAVVVSGGSDGTVRAWDLASGEPAVDPLIGHSDQVYTVAAADVSGRTVVVSGGDDRTVRVWDLSARFGA